MTNKLTAARLVPRAIAGATVSAYEAAPRSITDLERIAARTTTPEPLGVLAAALADHHDPTKGGVLEFFRMYRAAFPNLRMELEHVLASGDMVVARVRATGTHRGELMGMPATGRSRAADRHHAVRPGRPRGRAMGSRRHAGGDAAARRGRCKDSGIGSHERS